MYYHEDHLTQKMRIAIQDLQQESKKMFSNSKISIDDIRKRAENLNNIFTEFHKQVGTDIVSSIKKLESNINNEITFGCLTLGNFLVHNEDGKNIDISYLSSFNELNTKEMLPKDFQRIISHDIIAKRFSPSVASLWEIRNTLYNK